MDQVIFKQLEFVRSLTIQAVQGLSEQQLDVIPDGFNNNIRWNLGHIYLVQEKLGFQVCGESGDLPDHFAVLFGKGTKPADWEEELPSLETLVEMLEQQPNRLKKTFQSRLDEKVAEPFTTGSGLTMDTIWECLNYTLYHEGLHFQAINTLKRLTK